MIMYIYMCVYIYIYMCVCMYFLCMYVYLCMYVCMYACMHACMYVRTYVRMYVCMYPCYTVKQYIPVISHWKLNWSLARFVSSFSLHVTLGKAILQCIKKNLGGMSLMSVKNPSPFW